MRDMDLAEVLIKNRSRIVRKWSTRLLTRSGARYGERSLEELRSLTAGATDANYAVLIDNDYAKIDRFIEKIAHMRLDSGFMLSEVQKAFILYQTIVVPIITSRLEGKGLTQALNKLNKCLAYTITRFSDYFESLHEQHMREYAENLEMEVDNRTKELSESEAKYRVLVEEINDGYFVNQNGRIVFANRAFCHMHGYALEEVLGRPYLDFIAPQSMEQVRSFYEKRLDQENAPEQYMYYRLHKDSASLPTENRVKLIHYEGERAAAGICRDITERMKMEQRLREAENLAHIGQLTTSLAHEIRNPLSSIKMSIQMLLQTVKLSGNDKRTMEIAAREIERLEKILAEMLDFARPLRLSLGAASLNDVIVSCLELLKARIAEKKITVKRRLSGSLEPLLLDTGKIEQAIINILLNGIEVLPEGGTLWITTRRKSSERLMASVEIADDGPGVNSQDLPYIFDPFFSKKKKGTGLGLSNVKKIVEAHGGAVSASQGARGLCLTLSLPMRGI
jgi:PAS domain S-box-containing protein